MDNNELIEKLADYEHERWSRWQKHVFSKCIINPDGSFTIPKEFVDRWIRQINTNYKDLSEPEKDSDREEAIKIIECIKSNISNDL